MNYSDKIIVFFDGYCHLCNGFIDWLDQKDTRKVFYYAPLQGQTASELLRFKTEYNLDVPDSVIVKTHDDRLLVRSEAVIYLLEQVNMLTRARILRWIPHSLLDTAYRFVSVVRYKVWGRSESCRLPSPADSLRVLD